MEFHIEIGWISLVFLAALLAVVGVLIVKAVRRARRRRDTRRKTKQWLDEFSVLEEKTESYYTPEERLLSLHRIKALGPIPEGFKGHSLVVEAQEFLDGLSDRIAQVEAGIAATAERRRLDMATFAILQQNWDGYSVRERYAEFHKVYRLSLDHGASSWLADRKEQTTRDYYHTLIEGARSGSRSDFLEMYSFIESPEYRLLIGWYSGSGTSRYVHASDWDDLVVTYLKNPSLSDFSFVKTDQPAGEVRLMAARAIRERSLKDAKIALAFCAVVRYSSGSGDYWPYRDEIGDVLMAELAKLVVELHTEQNLTFASTLSSDS